MLSLPVSGSKESRAREARPEILVKHLPPPKKNIYIYTKVSGSGDRAVHANLQLWSFPGFRAFQCSVRSDLLKIAQRAPRAAQSRSESLRACPEPLRAAQSVRSELLEEPLWVAQSRSESPRAVAQGRPEFRVAQSAPRAAQSEEPLRIARSVPRAAQSHSELFEKPSGELGVTCTLHIRSSVLLHLVPSSPCMYMHGFALVYIYIYMLKVLRTMIPLVENLSVLGGIIFSVFRRPQLHFGTKTQMIELCKRTVPLQLYSNLLGS